MSEPEQSYLDLRDQALESGNRGLAVATPEHPRVIGVVVDVPASGGFATVVALVDGTTSLYTSAGGGTIGAGTHAPVVKANDSLLSIAEAHAHAFAESDERSLPPSGRVRFHLVTPEGVLISDVAEDSFWGRTPHALMPVIAAAQELISEISKV